jgi:hypothetical protein
MFEERGPQERAVFLEQLQRQPLVALRQRAVAHHVREHDRGEPAVFEPFDSHLSRHQPDDRSSRLTLPPWTSLRNAKTSARCSGMPKPVPSARRAPGNADIVGI